MTEAEKGASPTSKAKGESSFIDKDISKNFLGSWNSDDGSLDFNFDPVGKASKTTFNFDKMDMDFSLGGELEKIKSFKVDMDDLDFSSPPKDSNKSSVRAKGESSKSNQGQEDPFGFSFDFNELDNFDLDSYFPSGGKKPDKDEGVKKIISLDKQRCDDSGFVEVYDQKTVQEASKEKTAQLEVCNSQSSTLVAHQSLPNHPSDSDLSESSIPSHQLELKRSKFLPQSRIASNAQEANFKSNQVQVVMTIPNKSLEISTEQNPPLPILADDSCNPVTVLERMDVDPLNENSDDEPIDMQALGRHVPLSKSDCEFFSQKDMNTEQEGLQLNNSPSKGMAESGDTNKENIEPCGVDFFQGGADSMMIAKSNLYVEEDSFAIANVNAAQRIGTDMAGSTTERKEAPRVLLSTHFSRNNSMLKRDKTPVPVQTSSAREKLVTLNQNTMTSSLSGSSGARESIRASNTEDSGKSAGSATLSAKEITGGSLVSNISVKRVEDGSALGKGLNGRDSKISNRLSLKAGISDQKMFDIRIGSVEVGNESKNVKAFSSQIHSFLPPKRGSKSSQQSNEKLEPKILRAGPTPKFETTPIQGIKLLSLKDGKKISDLSNLKVSSTSAQESNKSERTSEHIGLHSTILMGHPVSGSKPISLAPSLKRRTDEAISDADLVPSHLVKRYLPSQNSNIQEPSKTAVEYEKPFNSSVKKTATDDEPTSTFDSTNKISIEENLSVTENDETIKKAEACAKQIDDMCNMLRRKEEEAKELLAQTIVNNNYLLLLDHPIHQEKLREVQEFAARLMSEEIPRTGVETA